MRLNFFAALSAISLIRDNYGNFHSIAKLFNFHENYLFGDFCRVPKKNEYIRENSFVSSIRQNVSRMKQKEKIFYCGLCGHSENIVGGDESEFILN